VTVIGSLSDIDAQPSSRVAAALPTSIHFRVGHPDPSAFTNIWHPNGR
jgi:hypothetical protein